MSNYEPSFYLGIDWGEKRIGLALADSETKIAMPLKTVANIKALREVVEEEQVDTLVIGEPIKMKGDSDNLNPLFLSFLKKVKKEFSELKIELIDERLTSKHADSLIGNKKTKASRDEISAMLILQTYFDKI